MNDDSAAFWRRRLGLLVVILAVGYATTLSLNLLGFSIEAREIVAYSFGLGLLAVGIDTVRRAPTSIPDAGADGGTVMSPRKSAGLLSAYFVLLWCLWAFGAMQLFWLATISAGLVWANGIAQRSVVHILRQAWCHSGAEMWGAGATLLSRGIRFILIISALLLLAWAWDIDLVSSARLTRPRADRSWRHQRRHHPARWPTWSGGSCGH